MPPGSDNPSSRAGHVHAVSKDVVAVDNDVADIDAHPKLDPTVGRNGHIPLAHSALNFGCAAHRIDRACKLD
jgi:hypothetical protein